MKLNSLFKHIPDEIRELFFIKIMSTYSYAVLYSSLILYMTNHVGLPSQMATGIVGVFISLNFILHFFGGYAGGKVISNRMLLLVGMVLELIGVATIPSNLLIGLGIFLTGSGLYATSIQAIMIQKYEPSDTRRELASFWLYSGMNLGFFLGNTISGYFHMKGNYMTLFYSAIATSFAALMLISMNWHKFTDKTTDLSKSPDRLQRSRLKLSVAMIPIFIFLVTLSLIYHSHASKLIMLLGGIIFCSTLILALKQPDQKDKNKVFAFLILVIAALAFWSLFFVGPMGMTLFIKHYVNKELMGITIPPQWFQNINTAIIIIGGPLLANWFKKKRETGSDLSFPMLFSMALLNIGAAYIVLTLGIWVSGQAHMVAIIWVVFSYVLQTIGELFISPVGVAMIGKLAPQGKQGLLLGIWAMVTGIASMISKFLSQMMEIPSQTVTPSSAIQSYNYVFAVIGWGALIAGILLFTFVPYVKRLISEERQVTPQIKDEVVNHL